MARWLFWNKCSFNTILLLIYIPSLLFKFDYIGWYNANAVVIQLAVILLIVFAAKTKGVKSAFVTSILLNTFIPLYFLDFVVYGDSLSLLCFAVILLIAQSELKDVLKAVILGLLFGIAYLCRATAIVWFIAMIIVYLLYKKITIKNSLVLLLMILLFFVPGKLCNYGITNKFGVNTKEHCLPTVTWIFIGTGYSIYGDAGIYNPLPVDTLNWTYFDKEYTTQVVTDEIKNNLQRLSSPKELVLFLKRKAVNTWTDPDFETTTFVMPEKDYYYSLDYWDHENEPVGVANTDESYTNSLGKFVYDHYHQINFVGYFILQFILETKPRYVLICFIIMIFNCAIHLPELLQDLD